MICGHVGDHRLTASVLDGATPTAAAMREADGAPLSEEEQDDDESDHVPSRLERAKMVLEMVWIIARLLGM